MPPRLLHRALPPSHGGALCDIIVHRPQDSACVILHHRGPQAVRYEAVRALNGDSEPPHCMLERAYRGVFNASTHPHEAILDVAFAQILDDQLWLGTAGLCGAVLLQGSHLELLHPLDSLLEEAPDNGMGRSSAWILVRTLGMTDDPDPLDALRVTTHRLQAGDAVALLGRSAAVPVIALGARPSLPPDSLDDWLDWFVRGAQASDDPRDGGVAVAILTHP